MRRKKWKKNSIYLMIMLVGILFLQTFNTTSSRYIGQIESNNDIVAIPILTLSNNKMNYSIPNMLPGDHQEYTFSVSNKENDSINEILLNYQLIITTDSILPLSIKLYNENSEEISITDGKTPEENMPYGTKTTRNYKMVISWDEKDNGAQYIGKTSKIHVELRAVQVV